MANGFVPHKHLAFVLMLMSFQFLAFGSNLAGVATLQEPVSQPTGFTDFDGMKDLIVDIGRKVVAMGNLLLSIVTFATVDGLPTWVKVPATGYVSVVFIAPFSDVVSTLLSGIGSLLPFT